MLYKKTTNPNIVKQITTREEPIDIKKLQEEITALEKIKYSILQYPKDVTPELKEAIDAYNEPTLMLKEEETERLKEKKELLNNCLKAIKNGYNLESSIISAR